MTREQRARLAKLCRAHSWLPQVHRWVPWTTRNAFANTASNRRIVASRIKQYERAAAHAERNGSPCLVVWRAAAAQSRHNLRKMERDAAKAVRS